MKFIALFAALAALPAVLANLTINTPANVVACQPTQFIWSGGSGPYYLSIVPAGQTAAPPLEQFPTQNGTSYTWLVNFAQGTSFTTALKDSTGATAYSDIITVTAGTSDSCVNASGSSGSSTTAGSGSSASGASTTGASSPTGASGSSGSSAAASSTASASGSTSTKSSGAGRLGVSSAFGVAAVMGLVGAAMF